MLEFRVEVEAINGDLSSRDATPGNFGLASENGVARHKCVEQTTVNRFCVFQGKRHALVVMHMELGPADEFEISIVDDDLKLSIITTGWTTPVWESPNSDESTPQDVDVPTVSPARLCHETQPTQPNCSPPPSD